MSPSNSRVEHRGSIDGNGASDDSMHEKYFKSVENTPISRRRHNTVSSKPTTKKHGSSGSSPQSPTSPQNNVYNYINLLNRCLKIFFFLFFSLLIQSHHDLPY